MKYYCQELNKEFLDKEELFKELMNIEDIILDQKKSQIYNSKEWCEKYGIKGLSISTNQQKIIKSLTNEQNKELKLSDDYYYFVVNSSNFLDSHRDVHIDGNWNKTKKESQGQVYLVFDHELKRSEIIAMKQDIELMTAYVSWDLLGKNYEGETYSLIYKVPKDKIINKQAKEWLEQGYSFEASVRMQYVKVELAINSTNPEFEKQKKVYDAIFPLIVNKKDYSEDDLQYFWVVREAKNVKESSLVMFGSNSGTGLLQNNKQIEQSQDTQIKIDEEQSQDTRKHNYLVI